VAAGASGVPISPGAPLLPHQDGIDPCPLGPPPVPLSLPEAVSRSLCGNPKTRGAWASIKLAAATVEVGRESYLPDLGITGKELESSTETRIKGNKQLDTNSQSLYPQGQLSLTWVLFDFGGRGAQLASARELFAASRANLDLNLQQVFLRAAADYFGAQAAQSSLTAAQDIVATTARSVEAAHLRVDRGASPVSDELQARTANAQAIVSRVKAEEELLAKRGALALDMGFDPDTPFKLPAAAADVNPGSAFTESLRELMEQAKRTHPSVVVAERQLAAARADERAARARGYPVVSLVGELLRSNEPLTPSLGSPSVPGSVTTKSIGIQLSIPISDPLWKRGLIARAHAQVGVQEQTLFEAEQQVARDVWDAHGALEADTENLTNSQTLLESAQQSFDSARRRYEGGVGNILELLSSQTAYANAQQQRIQAIADWHIARLALGASLGRLGMPDVEGPQ
jgi:outer membrane protein